MTETLYDCGTSKAKPKQLSVGDLVRINKTKHTFEKGYLPNWTRELFKITHVVNSDHPVTYKIEDLQGEPLRGTFYSQEVKRIQDTDQVYDTEAILDHRKRKVSGK